VSVSGDQTRCNVAITAGTGATVLPQIVFTFPDPSYPLAALSMAWQIGGTGMAADILNVTSNTQAFFTYTDLPAAGQTYIFVFDKLGV
jgi:hypothetical protein